MVEKANFVVIETEQSKRVTEDANAAEDAENSSLAEKSCADEIESLSKHDNTAVKEDETDDQIAEKEKSEKIRLKMEKAAAERAEYMAFMKSQE